MTYSTPYHLEDISKQRFLVTGGAGFIGSHLCQYLIEQGAGHVRVLDNLATGFLSNIEPLLDRGLELIEGDITDPEACAEACAGVNIVLHQAALGSVPRSLKDPAASHAVNVTGLINVLVAARDAGVTRLVYASSSSVYGDSPELPKKEEHRGNLLSPYAVTKMANELYADVFARCYGMQCMGLRYFNVFGPRQNPKGPYAAVIPLFIDMLKAGESPVINGDGSHSRDFTFVENVVQANLRAATAVTPYSHRVYNIAAGQRTTLNELYAIIQQGLGSSLNAVYGPNRPGDIAHSLADISRAQNELGYAPTVTVAQGLAQTLAGWGS